jgi:hypothetical protein
MYRHNGTLEITNSLWPNFGNCFKKYLAGNFLKVSRFRDGVKLGYGMEAPDRVR